eukprot:699271-Prorocentrum_minimum.AAC.2
MEARERQLEELQTLHAIYADDLVVEEEVLRFITDGDTGFIDESQQIEFDIRLQLQVADDRCGAFAGHDI